MIGKPGSSLPMYTYFIFEPIGGFIKIGKSRDPKGRLADLQTSHPSTLKILGVIDGDQERELHCRFSGSRIRENGEWFRSDPALKAFLKTQFGIEDDALQPGSPGGNVVQQGNGGSQIWLLCDIVIENIDEAHFEAQLLDAAGREMPCEFSHEESDDIWDYDNFDRQPECTCLTVKFVIETVETHSAFIQRFGMNAEEQLIYLDLKPLNTEARRRFLRTVIPKLGMMLDDIGWDFKCYTVDSKNYPAGVEIDGVGLALEHLVEEIQSGLRREACAARAGM